MFLLEVLIYDGSRKVHLDIASQFIETTPKIKSITSTH